MIAKELDTGDWFRWEDDWRVWSRLQGDTKIIEGKECIRVRPQQPTANMPAGYIPAEDEVVLFEGKSLRLN